MLSIHDEWRRQWHPTPALLPGESHGWRSLVGWSLRVQHNWVTSLSLFTFMHWRRKWQPTPVFLPGESQGRGSLVGCHLWSRTQLKRLRSSSSIHDESFFSCCFQDLLFVFVQFNSDMSRYGSFLYLKIIYFRFIDSLECLNWCFPQIEGILPLFLQFFFCFLSLLILALPLHVC